MNEALGQGQDFSGLRVPNLTVSAFTAPELWGLKTFGLHALMVGAPVKRRKFGCVWAHGALRCRPGGRIKLACARRAFCRI